MKTSGKIRFSFSLLFLAILLVSSSVIAKTVLPANQANNIVPPVVRGAEHYITDVANYSPQKIDYPFIVNDVVISDYENIVFEDTYYDLDCFSEMDDVAVTGMIERKWTTVNDDNKTTGIQTIYIRKQSLLDVVFPEDIDGVNSCDLEDRDFLGTPQINGKQIVNNEMSKIVVSFEDDITVLNSERKVIFRKWTVLDICADEQIERVQVINVEENELPALEVPEYLTFSTNATDKFAVVILPRPKLHDSCTEPTVTVSWKYGNGFGPYENIPVGMYRVDYIITNKNRMHNKYSTVVIVEDNEKPSILGKMRTDVFKGEGGNAVVFANFLNDGSFDNCGIDYFEVSLDGENFYDSVEIDTEGIEEEKEIEVVLRGYDVNGLFSDATTTVIVHSK